MDGTQSPGSAAPAPAPASPPSTQSDEAYQFPLSPVTSDDADDSSFGEGNSGEDSGINTASEPISEEVEPLDREAAATEITAVLNNYPEISVQLLEWARIFIDEHPEMLTRSSTIVDAYPDRDKAHAEFHRGISAICRIVSDERLDTVRNFAVNLEGEWVDALVKGSEEARYADYIDLMYSEAERVMEGGEGWYREEGDMEIVGEVFGFLEKEVNGEGDAAEMLAEDAMGNEG